MKNKLIKNITKIAAIIAGCLMLASFSPSLDGRAVVVDEGVFPSGIFAKTVGYLPGDIISVTNITGDATIDILVIGALDPSEGVAIMLSPEAAAAIGIDPTANNIVKITKRSNQDERVYGTAIIAKQDSNITIPETPVVETSEETFVQDDEDDVDNNDYYVPEVENQDEEVWTPDTTDDEETEDVVEVSESDYSDDFYAEYDDGKIVTSDDIKDETSEEIVEDPAVYEEYEEEYEAIEDELPAEEYTEDYEPEEDISEEEYIEESDESEIIEDEYEGGVIYEEVEEDVVEESFQDDEIASEEFVEEDFEEVEDDSEATENDVIAEEAFEEIEEEPFEEEIIEEEFTEEPFEEDVPEDSDDEVGKDIIYDYEIDEPADEVSEDFEDFEEETVDEVIEDEYVEDDFEEEFIQENETVEEVPFNEDEEVSEVIEEPAPVEVVEEIEEVVEEEIIEDDFIEDEYAEEGFVDEPEASEKAEEYEEYSAIVLVPATENASTVEALPSEEPVAEEFVEEIEETEIVEVVEEIKVVEEVKVESAPAAKPATTKANKPYKIVDDVSKLDSGKYYIQIATLKNQDNINEIINKYGSKYHVVVVGKEVEAKKVMIGPLSMDEYGTVLERFKSYGYKDAFVKKIK